MSVPPPMLAVPPPPIQGNMMDQMNNAQQPMIQQQNFIQNQTALVNAQPSTILQQQTIIPQTVPIHLHQGNMVIQQQVPTSNVNIPPPGLHIPVKQGPLVHLQAPPPTSVHLSQPPPNIQIQPQTAQIVLNQAQPNYQYQYIQQTPIQTTADGQQNQVTIQHIYQPQGIVQQQQQATQFNQFTTQQTIRPQQMQQTQQYILQGNTAYMVPPPNMLQQQPPQQAAPPQNIIFQPSQMQLQQVQMSQAPSEQPRMSTPNTNVNSSTGDDNTSIKEEKLNADCNESPVKSEDKPDTDGNGSAEPSNHPAPQPAHLPQCGQLPPTQVPPPIMAVPPPMTCVQHIVGNTLITTSQPTQTQTHQIYNQIPVSIQQIQAPQQQIHVSAPNGQHFLVNAQQWQPQQQFQQMSQNGNIQSFQLTTAPPMRNNPNEIVVSNQAIIGSTNQTANNLQTQQHILATTFNPHIPAPVTGMQVQFQPLASVATQQTQQIHQHSMMMQPPLPGAFNASQQQQSMPSGQQIDSLPKGQMYPQGSSPQPVPPPNQVLFIFTHHAWERIMTCCFRFSRCLTTNQCVLVINGNVISMTTLHHKCLQGWEWGEILSSSF